MAIDYSNLMNVAGNMQRGVQQPSNAFSSMSNMFGSGGAAGTGSAPMNLMPQQPGMQPGNNLQGFLSMLGGAFGGMGGTVASNPNLPAGGVGASLAQLGGLFDAARRPQAPVWAQRSGFGANEPQYLAEQAVRAGRRTPY